MENVSKLTLRVRDLKTGEEGLAAFEDEGEARAWLSARPPFVEVLGMASSVAPETSKALRAVMRALSPEEQRLVMELDQHAERARLSQKLEEERRAQAEAAAHAAAMRDGDPNRPMDIHWTFDHGMRLADAADPRAITDEARAAVLAWVAERNDWVRDRGQVVGEARLVVFPGPVPSGQERVKEGRFFPVTAPPAEKPN